MPQFSTVFNGIVPSTINTLKYNNQKYQLDIIFDNLQGNTFQLNVASIVSLDIEETATDWYRRASLTISNPENIFEQKITPGTTKKQYYKFRNDGRDVIYIRFKIIDDTQINTAPTNIDYNIWGMQYKFVIFDKEETPGDAPSKKTLKLYLWEYDQQLLAETTLQWSTNECLPSNIIPAYATDDQKLVNTGIAIKSLLNKALVNSEPPVFSTDWDIGSSKLFYSAPANYTAIDSLNYLMKKLVSAQIGADNGADPCIISRSRYDGTWNLTSFSTLFNQAINNKSSTPQAGNLQREIITLSYPGGNDSAGFLFELPQSPYGGGDGKTNIHHPTTSSITNINFTDMSTIDSTQDMVTTPCYSNDYNKKVFNIETVDNDITNVKSYIDKNYSNKMRISAKPDTLITLNKTKTNTLAIKNVYSFGGDKISRLAESRNFMLLAALYYNTTVSFQALGSPIRESSTFISIEKGKGVNMDEFHNKLLGQWFVHTVVHHFTLGEYTNTITAVRVHANDNIDIRSDII
jgi:hypothetical protein